MSSGGPQKLSEGWNTSPTKRHLGSGVVQPGEQKTQYLKSEEISKVKKDFTRAYSDRASDNNFKMKQGRFRLGIRNEFFLL